MKAEVLKTNANPPAFSPAQVKNIGPGILDLIGNTPLLPLRNIQKDYPGVTLFAKAEWFNPGGSVKDRAAIAIVESAERDGRLHEGVAILDASSGNTAVAYAMIATAKRYRATLCVPKNANALIFALLKAYDADVVLTDPMEGSDGAIREARRIARENPKKFVYLDQYNNPANWKAHYKTTAVEIWEQTKKSITHFVAGLGTTGTFTGTSRRLKELKSSIRTIAFQPDAALHGLEGLKHLESAMVPGIYDPELPDDTLWITTENAYQMMQQLRDEEGLLVGPSGGAAVAASMQVAKKVVNAHEEATIVTVLPDSGIRYAAEGILSTRSIT